MNKTVIVGLVSFILGTAGGGAAGYFLAKNKSKNEVNEKIAQAQEGIRGYYEKKYGVTEPINPADNVNVKEETEITKVPIKETSSIQSPVSDNLRYEQQIKQYSSGVNIEGQQMRGITPIDIVIIDVAEFQNENDEAQRITLEYYQDGVLADTDGNILTNAVNHVGYQWKEEIDRTGAYDVYVYNTALNIKYEILTVPKNYYPSPGE